MKTLLRLLGLALPLALAAQTVPQNVQKTSGTNEITASLVIGSGKTLSATGTGSIAASTVTGLSVAAGKTLTVSNSLTFTGTDSSSVNFGTGGTVLYSGGSGFVASVTGTADQVLANGTSGSAQTGAVTLTLPQSIATTSSPTFSGLTLGTTVMTDVANTAFTLQASANQDVIFRLGTGGDTFRFLQSSGEARVSARGWGNSADARAKVVMYSSRGTESSSSATTAGDYLGGVYFGGNGSSTTSAALANSAQFRALARENFSTTARGTAFIWGVVQNTTTNIVERMMLDQQGRLYLGTNVAAAGTAYLYGDLGDLQLVAQGTNKDISATPSGTGSFKVIGSADISQALSVGADAYTSAGVQINGAAGSSRTLKFYTASSLRWLVAANNTAESGSNAGSDFVIERRSDAGAYIDDAIKITRSSGLTTIYGALRPGSSSASASAWGVSGRQIQVPSATFTDSSTAASGTAASAVFSSFAVPTLAATNASVTTTTAATVYIAGDVAAGTNQTITNSYGLWNVGKTRLDGILSVTATTASTSTVTGSATFGGGIGVAGKGYFGDSVIVGNMSVTVNGFFAGGGAAGQGRFYYNAANGSTIQGQTASTYDLALANASGALLLANPTGTVTTHFPQTTEATTAGAGAITTAGGVYAAKKIVTASTITTLGGATFHTTSSALTDGAGASTGTLTNAPAAGNPTKWIGINDNGVTRYIPAW